MAIDYLKQSYYFFRSNFSSLLSIQLPFIIGLMLLQRTVIGDVEEGSNLQNELFLLTSMDLLFVPIYLGATIFYMQSIVDKQPISALQSWVWGLKNWGRLFFTFLLSALAISAGLMLLVLPGLYIAVRLGLANQVCLLERKGPMEALKISWAGTADLFWTLAKGLAIIYGLLFIAELLVAPIAEGSVITGMVLSAILDFLNVFGAIYSFRIYRAWRDREPIDDE
ncbi:MAG: hypothetical protein HWE12_14665 [Oceanospirillaceae bacterium]|nr:hypothetical protein [Oceanospirillaceae bacterium]